MFALVNIGSMWPNSEIILAFSEIQTVNIPDCLPRLHYLSGEKKLPPANLLDNEQF